MNSKEAEEYKQLKRRRDKLNAEVSEKRDVMKHANREFNLSDNELKTLNKRIKEYEDSIKDMTVSDHAIVRYCERVLGMDIDDIRADILAEKFGVVAKSKALGNGKYPIRNGRRAVVQNNSVVTVI